jgi:hypothetical protein
MPKCPLRSKIARAIIQDIDHVVENRMVYSVQFKNGNKLENFNGDKKKLWYCSFLLWRFKFGNLYLKETKL